MRTDWKILWKESVDNVDYGYDYAFPGLKPGEELHDTLVQETLGIARQCTKDVNARRPVWDHIENKLKCFMDLTTEKQKPDKPVVVIPLAYAILDILVTYMVSAYLYDRPYMRLSPRGPEDFVPVSLLEMVLDWQANRTNMAQAWRTVWMDAFTYGYGAATPQWEIKRGSRMVRPHPTAIGLSRLAPYAPTFLQGALENMGQPHSEPCVLYEGNRLRTIDPRRYLPNARVPIHEPQDGESVGWVTSDNIPLLIEREDAGDPILMNCKYLRHLGEARSSVFWGKPEAPTTDDEHPSDQIWLYRRIIPAAHGLGNSEKVEKWLFGVAGDQILIGCSPIEWNHDRFPVGVFAPCTNGRDVTPVSMLEMIAPLCDQADLLIKSRNENIMNGTNLQIVYDPNLISTAVMENPHPAGCLAMRTNRPFDGKGPKDAAHQLQVYDTTQGHIGDIQFLIQIIREVLGCMDNVQGIIRQRSESPTATEAGGARASALSRLENLARKFSEQFGQDMTYMMASQTQQLMEEDVVLQILGRNTYDLEAIYGMSVPISPLDVICEFDVEAQDGTIPNRDDIQGALQIGQMIMGNPVLSPRYDHDRLIQEIGRRGGFKNLRDFRLPGGMGLPQPQAQMMIASQDQIDQQVQAGNYAPVPEGVMPQ